MTRPVRIAAPVLGRTCVTSVLPGMSSAWRRETLAKVSNNELVTESQGSPRTE